MVNEENIVSGSVIRLDGIEWTVAYSWWSIEGSFVALERNGAKSFRKLGDVRKFGELVYSKTANSRENNGRKRNGD